MMTLRHNNHTGRWLSTFKHAFDPKQPNSFVIGSMDRPRKVEVYDISSQSTGKNSIQLQNIHNISGDDLNSVCSRNCFHPTENIIVGGNSSGRVYIFRENRKT
jgi:hypothetical protein